MYGIDTKSTGSRPNRLYQYFNKRNEYSELLAFMGSRYVIAFPPIVSPEGTLVVANPLISATSDLSKVQIGNTVYGVATPTDISTLQSNFQAGVDSVYNACVAKGSTPASHSLSDVVDGIMAITTETPTYELATALMTSDITPSGVCSCSQTYNNTGNYNAWHAFSGTLGGDAQSWCTNNQTVGAWIQYQFPTAVIITKLITTNRNTSTPRACKRFKFQGSNDGTTYTDIGGEYEITSNAKAYQQTFYIPNQTAYLYYRIYVLEAYNNTIRVGFGQIEMYKSSIVGYKSITTNGTYYASNDNLDGYNVVDVNVGTGIGDLIDFSSAAGANQLNEVSVTTTLDLDDLIFTSEAGGV